MIRVPDPLDWSYGLPCVYSRQYGACQQQHSTLPQVTLPDSLSVWQKDPLKTWGLYAQ